MPIVYFIEKKIMHYDMDINTLTNGSIDINHVILVAFTCIIVVYTVLFRKDDSSSTRIWITYILWGMFIFVLFVNIINYLFNMDLITSLFTNTEDNLILDPDDKSDYNVEETTVPEIKLEKQIFHIPDNKYNYEDAKAVCKAYGGRLATWKDLDKAYDKNADWCSMGWSDGQMALFPTQYEKWANLQTIPGHEQDCGRPGINGGYIANPNVQFGINCYGYKPVITPEESDAMKLAPLYPSTVRERAFDKRVDYWKSKLPDVQVSPFNHNNWSML